MAAVVPGQSRTDTRIVPLAVGAEEIDAVFRGQLDEKSTAVVSLRHD